MFICKDVLIGLDLTHGVRDLRSFIFRANSELSSAPVNLGNRRGLLFVGFGLCSCFLGSSSIMAEVSSCVDNMLGPQAA